MKASKLIVPAALLGVGALGLVVLGAGESERDPAEVEPTGFPDPIAVGFEDDPEIDALVREMQDEFVSRGVDLNVISVAEVTRMRKAPGGPLAIPPRSWWPKMARTITEVYMPLRYEAGVPFNITSGYRPPDYNKAVTCEREVNGECVEWSRGSRHQGFEAIDFVPASGADAIARSAAHLYLQRGRDLKMGLGIYGWPATRLHIDTGHKRRTWENTRRYLDLVRGTTA